LIEYCLFYKLIFFLGAGVTAGKAANIPTVGILTSQAPERLLAAGATITVKDYHELLAHVQQGAPITQ
jgi:phosphoglycolate phosphatase-like HAD superfamily hydrolase